MINALELGKQLLTIYHQLSHLHIYLNQQGFPSWKGRKKLTLKKPLKDAIQNLHSFFLSVFFYSPFF